MPQSLPAPLKLGDPAEMLPNGTMFAYFDVFLTLTNLNQLICGLLDPAVPGLSFLAPLRQALTGAGTPIQCPATSTTTTTTTTTAASSPASGVSTPASPASGPLSAAAQAARNLSTDLYGALGAPTSSGASAGSGSSGSRSGSGVLQQILGGLL